MPILFGLSLLFSILLCVHAVRSGQDSFWLWIILMFQPLGGLVYVAAIIVPGVFGGAKAKRLSAEARKALDPNREYREATAAAEDAPTVRNQSRLAAAAASLGRYDEAERLYREAAQGIHADDPALLLGRAHALVELGRYAEARDILEGFSQDGDGRRAPSATLLLARVHDGLGQTEEARWEYQSALERLPGFEAAGRYAAFLARTGNRAQAQEMLAEFDRRIAKTNRHFRAEARTWRDLAAQAVNGAATKP